MCNLLMLLCPPVRKNWLSFLHHTASEETELRNEHTHTTQKTKELLFPISDLSTAILQGFFSDSETVSWHKTVQVNPLRMVSM